MKKKLNAQAPTWTPPPESVIASSTGVNSYDSLDEPLTAFSYTPNPTQAVSTTTPPASVSQWGTPSRTNVTILRPNNNISGTHLNSNKMNATSQDFNTSARNISQSPPFGSLASHPGVQTPTASLVHAPTQSSIFSTTKISSAPANVQKSISVNQPLLADANVYDSLDNLSALSFNVVGNNPSSPLNAAYVVQDDNAQVSSYGGYATDIAGSHYGSYLQESAYSDKPGPNYVYMEAEEEKLEPVYYVVSEKEELKEKPKEPQKHAPSHTPKQEQDLFNKTLLSLMPIFEQASANGKLVDDKHLSPTKRLLRLHPELAQNHNRDWNEEFQAIYDQDLWSFAEVVAKTRHLDNLNREFCAFSRTVAELIVKDLALPEAERLIPPIATQQGIAGGLKYRVGSVFFKFATDCHGLYGSDDLSHKAASHEHRAINAVVECNIKGLHITLSSLSYIRGNCIMAIAMVPVDGETTLVYGSCDAGRSFKTSSETMNELMRELGSRMNLKEHIVIGFNSKQEHIVHSAGDVEGHFSPTDGRHYLIDLARHVPPVVPRRGTVDFLTHQFRPEHMFARLKDKLPPLSSDCWTVWGRHNVVVHNAEAREAHNALLTNTLPKFAKYFQQAVEKDAPSSLSSYISPLSPLPATIPSFSSSLSRQVSYVGAGSRSPLDTKEFHLTREMHKAGLNLRDLGRVLACLPTDAKKARLLIYREVISRSIKVRLRQGLRYLSRTCSTNEPFMVLAAHLLAVTIVRPHPIASALPSTPTKLSKPSISTTPPKPNPPTSPPTAPKPMSWSEKAAAAALKQKQMSTPPKSTPTSSPSLPTASQAKPIPPDTPSIPAPTSTVLEPPPLPPTITLSSKSIGTSHTELFDYFWNEVLWVDLNNKFGIEPSVVSSEERKALQDYFCCDNSLPALLAYFKSPCGAFLLEKMSLINSPRLSRAVSTPAPFSPPSTSSSSSSSSSASSSSSSSSSSSMSGGISPISSSAPSCSSASASSSCPSSFTSFPQPTTSTQPILPSTIPATTTTTPTTTSPTTTATTPPTTATTPPSNNTSVPTSIDTFTAKHLAPQAKVPHASPTPSASPAHRFRSVNSSPSVSRSSSPHSIIDDDLESEETPSFSCHVLQYPTYLLRTTLSLPSSIDPTSPYALVFEALNQLHFHIGIKEKYLRNPDFSRLNRAEKHLARHIREKGLANEDNSARLSAILLELADETDVGALSIIQKEMATLQQWKEFHPLMIFGQLASNMTTLIVDSVIKQDRSKLTPARLRELLLQYCALAHLLTAFATRYPVIRRRANEKVNNFLQDPSTRTKTHTHDLGQFLIHFLLSDVQWDQLAILILLELFDRQVRWLLQRFPECQAPDEGERGCTVTRCYRLSRAWESGLVGCQLFMLQVLFFRLTKQNLSAGSVVESGGFHRTLGAPREEDVQQLLKWSDTIMKIDGWPQFFDVLQVARLSPNNLEARLKQAQRNSLEKGYHTRFRVHHLERFQFRPCLCPKGLCRYADIDLPKTILTRQPSARNMSGRREDRSRNSIGSQAHHRPNPAAAPFTSATMNSSCTSSHSSTSSIASISSNPSPQAVSTSSSVQTSYSAYTSGCPASLTSSDAAYGATPSSYATSYASSLAVAPSEAILASAASETPCKKGDDNGVPDPTGDVEEETPQVAENQGNQEEGWEVIASKRKKESEGKKTERARGEVEARPKSFGRGAARAVRPETGRGRGKERKFSDHV